MVHETRLTARLERRRQLAGVLGEVDRQNLELPDGLGLGHRLVGVVDGLLAGRQQRIVHVGGEFGHRRAQLPTAVPAAGQQPMHLEARGQPSVAAAIRGFRNRLLGEHLDVPEIELEPLGGRA